MFVQRFISRVQETHELFQYQHLQAENVSRGLVIICVLARSPSCGSLTERWNVVTAISGDSPKNIGLMWWVTWGGKAGLQSLVTAQGHAAKSAISDP